MDVDIDQAAIELGENLIDQILSNATTEMILAALDSGAPVWYQNQLEGISTLHAAASMQNLDLVHLLIEKGAVWNAGMHSISTFLSRLIYNCLVDYLKNTAGDIALSFNNEAIYRVIRDAGIRSGASKV